MKIHKTDLEGVFLVDEEPIIDVRGEFSRTYCKVVFENFGLDSVFVQANRGYSKFTGTLRGFHYQKHPFQESKYVRIKKGKILDVALDIRTDSPTYLQHFSCILTAEEGRGIYLSKGFAHAVLTLEDHSEIEYLVSSPYSPDYESGVRWNDPKLNVEWPIEPLIISEKDQNWPFL